MGILNGQVILVTGAANRVGKGIALQLAKAGSTVALHYFRSIEEIQVTAKEIESIGGKVAYFQADIANLEEVEHMHQAIQSTLGNVTGVVNNAGLANLKSLFDYKPNEWQRELDVCLNGVIHLAYTFIPSMKINNNGKFITIIGDSARTGDRKLIISAAARSGVISFMKSLAQEVGRHHIQCNTISLGLLDQGDIHLDERAYKQLLKNYPLQRFGNVNDVTGIIQFLLSNEANWITGQVFSVNGGYTML